MADVDVDINEAANEAALYAWRRDALENGGMELLIVAQEECPVDTGNLRRNHKLGEPNANATEIEIVADTDYSLPVHDGHRIVAWGHDTGRYQPANPWLRRAIDRKAL